MGAVTRLRYGRFYTPPDVVDLALDAAIRTPADRVWDPTCGDGAFLRRAAERGHPAALLRGTDIDDAAVAAAAQALPGADLSVADLFSGTDGEYDVIVGNPPFVRVERLPAERRSSLRAAVAAATGFTPPAQADLAVLALLCSLQRLAPGGRLAFVMPNTWMDADYGRPVRRWLLERFRLVSVIESRARPWFPEARVNTVIVVLERSTPGGWARFVSLPSPARLAHPADDRWGPLLRAPDCWFDVLGRAPLVPLGDVLEMGYGTKVGITAFFSPRRAGGLATVEPASRQPFVRSLRGLHRYRISADEVAGEVFVPTEPPGPGAAARIAWGEQQRTSTGVPWPEVPSVRGNRPWYRLGPLRSGDVIVPQFRAERHYALANPDRVPVNNSAWWGTWRDPAHRQVGTALLNSTWAALAAEVLGRVNLGEGLLTCYGPDLADLPLPDPARFVGTAPGRRLLAAWRGMEQRDVLPLRDELLRGDRRALDAAVADGLGLDAALAGRLRKGASALCEQRLTLARALREAR